MLIKKPHEIEPQTYAKVLVYGQPKIGKTTLALSAPKPLLLDFDRGVNRVRDEHKTDTVQISSWKDVQDLLRENLAAYETLVIDTVGRMLDYISAHVIKESTKNKRGDGQLSLQGYGAVAAVFSAFLSDVSVLKKHLIFVAHEKETKGDGKDDGLTIKRPEIKGSSGNNLYRDMDIVAYMQAKEDARTLHVSPSEAFYAGNALSLPPSISVPILDKKERFNNFFSDIFSQYEQKNIEKREKLQEYHAFIMDRMADILDIETIEGANQMMQNMESWGSMFDSKIRLWKALRTHCKEKGIEYDKEAKIFVEKKCTQKEDAENLT